MPVQRRGQEVPIEGSWRLIEGEHDSFDTSIVPDDEDLYISSQQPSQLSSGSPGQSFDNSQDDKLQSFLSKAEDERIILRSPFRPSLPASARHSSRETGRHRSPDPEFFMPSVEVESPRRGGTRSSTYARNVERTFLRQRQVTRGPRDVKERYEQRHLPGAGSNLGDRIARSLPSAILDVFAWALGIVGLAFRYAQKPLAIVLAVYLCFGGLIIAQNMVTKSIATSMSPLCRLPGSSWLNLPFCPTVIPIGQDHGGGTLEFDGLMNVQENFEEILEKSASGISLPLEMKRSETSIRDLRTLVRYSKLHRKDDLVHEFDGFIDVARTVSNDLLKFNAHVGSAIDYVISINRWTSSYIASLSTDREREGWLQDLAHWAFLPFQPTGLSERVLLDQYVQHTGLVSEKIQGLLVEANAVLLTLALAEDHLGFIYDFVKTTQESVQSDKDDVLWTLWTLVGANHKHIHNLNKQLSLLKKVDLQRSTAIKQVSDLVVELEKIKASLDDLRDRVTNPGITSVGETANIPLRVHVETINRGIERLELARIRIRAVEHEKIAQALEGNPKDQKMIESK